VSLSVDTLIDYLKTDLAIEIGDLNPDTPLFSSGIIDSFALVSLMMFVESEGGIRIPPSDVTLTNLDSISRIQDYVRRQQSCH
jgi:acyl carrier protein